MAKAAEMFLLRCPKCRNKMNYQPREKMWSSNRKMCVYCGRSFKTSDNIVRKNTSSH